MAGCGLIVSFLPLCNGGSQASAGPLPPTSSNTNHIAFASNRDGNFEIYTTTPDGKDVQRLTNNSGDDREPAWNRDHSKIAFVSNRDGNSEIYVLNVVNGRASGQAQRITNDVARDRAPSWNPEGTQIVFESYRIDQRLNLLYILDVATGITRQLTQRAEFEGYDPAWSPRGDLIAFVSSPSNAGDFRDGVPFYLSTIRTDGKGYKKITDGSRSAYRNPAWHPNGQILIFGKFSGLSTINADGTNEKLLNPEFPQFAKADYSLDGSHIAFSGVFIGVDGNTSTNMKIVVVNAENSFDVPKHVITNSGVDIEPSW